MEGETEATSSALETRSFPGAPRLRRPPEAPPEGDLHGRLVDGNGLPLEGAEVHLLGVLAPDPSEPEAAPLAFRRSRTRTGPAGRFGLRRSELPTHRLHIAYEAAPGHLQLRSSTLGPEGGVSRDGAASRVRALGPTSFSDEGLDLRLRLETEAGQGLAGHVEISPVGEDVAFRLDSDRGGLLRFEFSQEWPALEFTARTPGYPDVEGLLVPERARRAFSPRAALELLRDPAGAERFAFRVRYERPVVALVVRFPEGEATAAVGTGIRIVHPEQDSARLGIRVRPAFSVPTLAEDVFQQVVARTATIPCATGEYVVEVVLGEEAEHGGLTRVRGFYRDRVRVREGLVELHPVFVKPVILVGRVLLDETPVPGATLWRGRTDGDLHGRAWPISWTDETGRFRLPVPPARRVALTVFATRPVVEEVEVAAGEPALFICSAHADETADIHHVPPGATHDCGEVLLEPFSAPADAGSRRRPGGPR